MNFNYKLYSTISFTGNPRERERERERRMRLVSYSGGFGYVAKTKRYPNLVFL